MLNLLLPFLKAHMDAMIGAIAALIPTLATGLYILYRKIIPIGTNKKLSPSKVHLLSEKNFDRCIMQYESYVQNDPTITHIHIMGMPHPLKLLEIYVPLYLHPHSTLPYTLDPIYRDNEETLELEALLLADQKTLALRVSESLKADDVLKHYPRCVIIGDPGIGKTTLLRYLTLKAVHKELTDTPCTPVYIQLNTFDPEQHKDLFDIILAQFSNIMPLPDLLVQLQKKMHEGKILLLLDGLDETRVGHNAQRMENIYVLLVKNIEQLAAAYPHMPIIVAVRKAGYQHQSKVKGFHELEIMDFRPEDCKTFVNNWFYAHPISNQTEKIKDLNTRLERNLRLQSLASNPLLLSLIVIVYEGHLHLPERRADLYKKCIEVLQIQWDASRNIQRKHEFPLIFQPQLLQEVAWHFHTQNKRYFPTEELLHVIQRFLPTVDIPVDHSRHVLEQIAIENGLLREQAQGWYGFSHLTFQEYFVTQYIIANQCQDVLLQHLHDPQWEEILLLYVGSVNDASPLLSILLNQNGQVPLPDDIFHTYLILAGRCLSEKPRVSKQNLRVQIIDQLFQTLLSTPYTLARKRIAHTLAGMNNPPVNDRLLTLLASHNDANLAVRESVGRALGHAGERTLALELVSLLRQTHIERYIRIIIARTLSMMGESSIVSNLLTLLKDPQEDPFVRQSIALTLGLIGERSVVPSLLQICQRKHEHALVLQSITLALEKLEDRQAVPVLIKMLQAKHLDWYVRGNSAQVLGKLRSKDCIPILLEILKDRDENIYVRRCVALALGTFKQIDLPLSYLFNLLRSIQVDSSIRASIVSSFATIGDRKVIPQLIHLLEDENTSSRVRISVALTLGLLSDVHDKQTMTTLSIIYHHQQSDEHLHTSIVIALGTLGVREVIHDLLNLFTDANLPQDMLPHIVHALSSLENHNSIDKQYIALKLVHRLMIPQLDRYRGQCILKVLDGLREPSIVPLLYEILANPAIDRSIRHGVADNIAQLAQDEETEAQLYTSLTHTDIPDDIYRTLWIVSRHVKRE